MKILLIGASGNIGQRILNEALSNGYEVTAAQRNPQALETQHPNLAVVKADALNEAELSLLLDEHDLIISSVSPDGGSTPELFKKINQNLVTALQNQPDKRLIVVGGAGSTEVKPGLKLMHSPVMDTLPKEWIPAIFIHAEVLELLKVSGLNWTYFSPPAYITAGQRTGKYRLGTTNMIFDDNGESKVSYEDYAVALIDEIANPKALKQQFSIGY